MIGGIAVLVLIGGIAVYAAQRQSANEDTMKQEALVAKDKEKDSAMMENKSTTTDKPVMKNAESAMSSHGSYEVYSADKVALASATHKVILFFRAGWCPTCRALDADIKAHITNIPASVTILEVDYDNSTDLKMKYGVRTQHTLVEVNAQGTLLQKWLGSPTLADLVAHVK